MASFTLALASLIVIGAVSYQSTGRLMETASWVARTHKILENLEAVLSALKDAESGQRGFIITGEERYLEPYQAALPLIRQHEKTLHDTMEDA